MVRRPVSAGTWLAMLGMGVPLTSLGVQLSVTVLQKFTVVSQSWSSRQPPAGSQPPFLEHMPLRHFTSVPGVQGPSPVA